MFSNSVKYAIKAVLFLAANSDEINRIMVKDVSLAIDVPHPYLAKLLQELSKRKIISSKKGPKGGFYLNGKNKDSTLVNIIYAIDGEKIDSCVLNLEKCNTIHPCPLHKITYPYKSNFLNRLNGITIRELSEDIKLGKTFLSL
jgi:Rrf2 family protein